MLISPNAVQSPMITSGFGTRPAIVGGVRKMPLPIVMPMISAVPPENPMTRRRSWPAVTLKALSLETVQRHFFRLCTFLVFRHASVIASPTGVLVGGFQHYARTS